LLQGQVMTDQPFNAYLAFFEQVQGDTQVFG